MNAQQGLTTISLARHSARCLRSLLSAIAALLSACSSSEVLVPHTVELISPDTPAAEQQLLDVGVRLFDPGVPQGPISHEVEEELLAKRIYVHIRRSEAVVMAVQLRDTLTRSGHWGAVWVTPEPSAATDLMVTAKILHSDGDLARVAVEAVDATGRVWLERPYEMHTAAAAYRRERYALDPYQDLFNAIANDLAAVQAGLSAADLESIRTVAQLRYASELSPARFDGYVAENDGRYSPLRLPAADDPTFARTQRARQREGLFFETLNLHYEHFKAQATPSYDTWRQGSREESIAIREATRGARWRKGLGIAAMVASIAYGGAGDAGSVANAVVRGGLMSVAVGFLEMSATSAQERSLHAAVLEELSASFDEEVEPLVARIGETQHRLTGTASAQYAEWRDLLEQLYRDESMPLEQMSVTPESDVSLHVEAAAGSDAAVESSPAVPR